MSDEGSRGQQGKYRQRCQQPIDNPEIPESNDWWNKVCEAHGEKNYWPTKKNKFDKSDN